MFWEKSPILEIWRAWIKVVIFCNANLNYVQATQSNAVMLLFYSCWTTTTVQRVHIAMASIHSFVLPLLAALYHYQTFRGEMTYLFLPDFQVNLGFQGNQSDQVVQALRGILGCQEGREDRVAPESCCDIQRESDWASCQFCSSDLQEKNESFGFRLHLCFNDSETP